MAGKRHTLSPLQSLIRHCTTRCPRSMDNRCRSRELFQTDDGHRCPSPARGTNIRQIGATSRGARAAACTASWNSCFPVIYGSLSSTPRLSPTLCTASFLSNGCETSWNCWLGGCVFYVEELWSALLMVGKRGSPATSLVGYIVAGAFSLPSICEATLVMRSC